MKYFLELRLAFLRDIAFKAKISWSLVNPLQKVPFLLVRFLWTRKENEQTISLKYILPTRYGIEP
jgi:hypothetical protein